MKYSHKLLLCLVVLLVVGSACEPPPGATNTTNEVSGEVFPANEVCEYPEIPIIKKYGGFNSKWGKRDTEVDLGAEFRYLCSPYPTKRLLIVNGGFSSRNVTLTYDARGNKIEGAHTIYIE